MSNIKHTTTSTAPMTPQYSIYTHSTTTTPLGLNQHLAKANKRDTRECNEQPSSGISSRWNPTPEQLLVLEEMYRRGTRTPTADEIQQIAAQLRRFGKIEGKNVFYWFQNHKARERQKRRRELESNCEVLVCNTNEKHGKKESGFGRSVCGDEKAKNLEPPSNCSSSKHSAEGLVYIRPAATADSSTHGLSQFEREELNQRSNSKHAMWLTKNLSSNTITTTSTFLSLQRNSTTPLKFKRYIDHIDPDEDEIKAVETLQLFPICDDCNNNVSSGGRSKKDIKVPIRTINTNFSPNQFIEFLPLKN